MTFVSRLKTNVKGALDVELGRKTLVVGPPASHKSGLVSALSLALTGKVDELGSAPAELLALRPAGDDELYADLEFSSGEKSSWRIKGGSTARGKKPERSGLQGQFLGRVVQEVLASEPKRRRESLLRIIAPSNLLAKARAEVPQAFQGEWDRLVAAASADSESEADTLVKVAELLRSELKEARATLKEELPFGPLKPSALAEADYLARIAALEKEEQAAIRSAAAVQRLAALDREVPAVQVEGTLDLKKLEAVMSATEKVQARLAEKHDTGLCMTCGGEVDSTLIGKAREGLVAAKLWLTSEKAKASKAKTGRSVEELEAEKAECREAMCDGRPAAQIAVDLTVERGRLRHLTEQAITYQLYETALAKASKAARQVEALSGLAKTADRLVAQALDSGTVEFVKLGSDALPSGYKLGVELFDGSRSVCRIGLVRPGQSSLTPIQALSGVERALCFSALTAAWARSVAGSVKLVTVDDVWMDSGSLRSLCDGISKVVGTENGPTQAIVCAVTLYGDPPPEDWRVVQLGAANVG